MEPEIIEQTPGPVTAIAVQPPPPAPHELFRVATDVAGVCKAIVKRTAKKIQGRNHVCIEGWQAIAAAHGCTLSIEEVREDESGDVTAIASVRRMSDGAILAKAEGFVGSDEKMWMNRPRYARRAMAQTRAMSRAARSAFAHVVVLIDAGLSTTPAEEMGLHDEGPYPTRDEPEPSPTPPQEPRHPSDDPLIKTDVFREALDSEFKARQFSPESADVAINRICARANVPTLESLNLRRRHEAIEAVKAGQLDKYKMNGQPTEPATA